jgi:hypothetical protein
VNLLIFHLIIFVLSASGAEQRASGGGKGDCPPIAGFRGATVFDVIPPVVGKGSCSICRHLVFFLSRGLRSREVSGKVQPFP